MAIQQGFVLSRKAYDIGQQTRIELWVSTSQGACRLVIDGQKPVFFLDQSDVERVKRLVLERRLPVTFKNLGLQSFGLSPMAGCYSPTIRVSKQLVQLLNQHDIEAFETDIPLAERYLMERHITGSLEFTGFKQNDRDQVSCQTIHQPSCRTALYQPTLTLLILTTDTLPDGTVQAIGLKSSKNQVLLKLDRDTSSPREHRYSNETDLLRALALWLESQDPDVIIGWQIQYHLSVLTRAAKRLGMRLALGRQQQPLNLLPLNTTKRAAYLGCSGSGRIRYSRTTSNSDLSI